MPVTRVGSPPLIAAPAQQWTTLLTVSMQAQNISVEVIGPTRKTVISLELGLYQPAKKLQIARQDLKNLILHAGELHIVMAQLRTIGAFIKNSGLDVCWIESELYGPKTAKQIINGNHIKRGETAHIMTLQALFAMYQEAFFQQHVSDPSTLKDIAMQLDGTYASDSKQGLKEVHAKMIDAIESKKIMEKMKTYDDKQADKFPLFKVWRYYMRMVLEMTFIRAVRTGDWKLHLEALELFTKYFFAHYRLNYARMIPVYQADMQMLPDTDPEIHEEFQQGNWVVNKNANTAFCALGADNALEHINRSMKVSG